MFEEFIKYKNGPCSACTFPDEYVPTDCEGCPINDQRLGWIAAMDRIRSIAATFDAWHVVNFINKEIGKNG